MFKEAKVKRIFGRFILVLLMVALVATPVFASGLIAEVELSDIEVDGGTHPGDTVVVSGTVTVTAVSDVSGADYAEASSEAWYSITDPDSAVITEDSNSEYDEDYAGWWSGADADASQSYSWSDTFTLDSGTGDYKIAQGGSASAYYSEGFWFWFHDDSADDSDSNFVMWTCVVKRNPSIAYSPDRFAVTVLGAYREYHWADGFTGGRILRDRVEQEGSNDTHLKVEIPAGTVINESGARAYELTLKCYQERITVETSPALLTFSEPAVISKLVDGEWVEVGSYTELADGQEL